MKKTYNYKCKRTKRTRSKSRTKNTIKKRRQKGSSKAGSSKAGSSKAGSSKAGPTLSIIYAKIGNYADKPQITLSNYNAPYLLTMLDPDAPAGTWTHYVAIINNGKDAKKEPYKYQPPSPPPGSGTHRYIFQAYELSTGIEVNTYVNVLTSDYKGHEYFVKVLAPFLLNKKKLGNEVEFLVEASSKV